MTIVKSILEAGVATRTSYSIDRRVIKLLEEAGEAASAHLSYTSRENKRKHTYTDVIEECADVVIVAIDIAMCHMHNENIEDSKKEELFKKMIEHKLNKWLTKGSTDT